MHEPERDIVKRREIRFQGPHGDAQQSRSAQMLLEGADGIIELQAPTPELLVVTYDVRFLTLEHIEGALAEVGFHLDNSLVAKLRRALWYYTDETQRELLGCKGNPSCTARIFVNCYERSAHGCRDERPRHWRRYL